MTNFALTYPSLTLADAVDPAAAPGGATAADLEAAAAAACRVQFAALGLEDLVDPAGASERWYWAAPLLMDVRDDDRRPVVEAWLPSRAANPGADGELSGSAYADHVRLLARVLGGDRSALKLGPIPPDLFEALGRAAVAAPAVALLRTLRRFYPDGGGGPDPPGRCDAAFTAARRLLTIFNRPEAVAAVRIAVGADRAEESHWAKTLRYCVSGCLQAVLDEYAHLLRTECDTAAEAADRVAEAATIKATTIDVDDLGGFLAGRKRGLRYHVAVDFGNQRMEAAAGLDRVTTVRRSFNSPFRPFVLATTSVGQEGLDFHRYCRKVVHWDLPANPIDLEQREGRVDRYESHSVRTRAANRYGAKLTPSDRAGGDAWDRLFKIAADRERRRGPGACDLVPRWRLRGDDSGRGAIERLVLLLPYSRNRERLASLLETLAVYRLAFGQPGQAALADRLRGAFTLEQLDEVRRALLIDLSPFNFRSPKAPGPEASRAPDREEHDGGRGSLRPQFLPLAAEALSHLAEQPRPVDQLDRPLPLRGLAARQDPDVGGDAGVVKSICRQGDDCLQQVAAVLRRGFRIADYTHLKDILLVHAPRRHRALRTTRRAFSRVRSPSPRRKTGASRMNRSKTPGKSSETFPRCVATTSPGSTPPDTANSALSVPAMNPVCRTSRATCEAVSTVESARGPAGSRPSDIPASVVNEWERETCRRSFERSAERLDPKPPRIFAQEQFAHVHRCATHRRVFGRAEQRPSDRSRKRRQPCGRFVHES